MLEHLYHYLAPVCDTKLCLIDDTLSHTLGIFPAETAPHICIGHGEKTAVFAATLLLHWGTDAAAAYQKAQEILAMFCAPFVLDGVPVYHVTTAAPAFQKRTAKGICEITMPITLRYQKE